LTRSDADGRFASRSIVPGKVSVKVRHRGYAPWTCKLQLAAGGDAYVEATLEPEARIEGRATYPDGSPFKGARLQVAKRGAFLSVHTQTGPDGRYALGELPSGTFWLTASYPNRGRARTKVETVSGGTVTWDPVLQGGIELIGRITDQHGAPRAGWLLRAALCDRPGAWDGEAKTKSDGTFRITNVPEGTVRLAVYDPSGIIPVRILERIDPSGQRIDIVITEAELPSAWITGRVLGPDGDPARGARISIRPQGAHWPRLFTVEPDGGFRVGPLPSSLYDVRIVCTDGTQVLFDRLTLGPSDERDLGTVDLEEPGTVEVALPAATAAKPPIVRVLQADRRCSAPCSREGRALRIHPLAPGDYVLEIGPDIDRLQRLPFTVRAGETSRLVAAW
jgi:hypothetical protein